MESFISVGVHMVQAAKSAGVSRFCFSGVIHPAVAKMRNHAAKQPVEEALYESGLAYTVLQPTMFMQTMEPAWPQVAKTGKFGLPFSPKARVSFVDYRDVAEAAADALTVQVGRRMNAA